MKKLLVVLFVLLVKLPVFGQELDFKATIDTLKDGAKIILNVNLEIIGGSPEFKVFCMDGIPGQSAKIVVNGIKVSDREYQLKKITLSTFHVCVLDAKQKLLCKKNDMLKPKE